VRAVLPAFGLLFAASCGHHDTPLATYRAPLPDDPEASADAPAGPPCMQTYSTTPPGLTSRYKEVAPGQPWVIAERDCESEGAHLVVIDDDAENLYVKTVAEKAITNNNSTHQLAWIGLGDQATEGEFEWVTGSPVSLALWFDGEPNSLYGNEDCVEVRATGQWNDDRCEAALSYVCECDGIASTGKWCDTQTAATCGDCNTPCPPPQSCVNQRCM
jgi:Lectin C-type domain